MTTQELPPLSAGDEIRGWLVDRSRVKAGKHRASTGVPIRPGASRSPAKVSIITTLATVAALAAWFVTYAFLLSGFQESHDQHVLYTRLRAYLASERVPFGGAIAPGTPVALISAPSIGLRSVVVEGTSSAQLEHGPGHYPTTPFPGQAGVAVLFGRSATFGSPFGSIGSLKAGQNIYVTTGQGVFTYRVDGVRHGGDPQPAPPATGQSRLELVTSEASGWRSGWAPTASMYVDASLASGKVQPAPPGRPSLAPAADAEMASDTGDLIPLVLWLQAMLLVVAGCVYVYLRWGVWQLWLIGLPVLIAVLWGVTSSTMLLLPNLA